MVIKTKGQFGNIVLLTDNYKEFRKILQDQYGNILYTGIKTVDFVEYYRVTLKDMFK